MSPRELDWERLDRYVAGEGTPEEREALQRWVEADPALGVVAEVMRTAQRLPGAGPNGWDAERSWTVVADRLGLSGEPARPADPVPVARDRSGQARLMLQLAAGARRRRVWHLGVWVVIAAALVAVVGGERWLGGLLPIGRPATASVGGREYTTLHGQRLVVHLPDRTQVTLAPGSRLRLTSDYGRKSRIVDLQGQAYFIVTHDAARPFAVRAGWLVARDLGTRFVVRAYPGDSVASIVVAEGLVALDRSGTADDGLLLGSGDLGRVTASGDITSVNGVAVERYLAWTAGELRFDGTPLREVAVELSRWYDIDVRLADPSLGDEQVVASFSDEPAGAVVEKIAVAAGLVVDQRDAGFTLRRPRR